MPETCRSSSISTYSASDMLPVRVHSTALEAALGQRAADDLGERREDRVLQLRQDEADQAGALTAQLGRAFVPEHVERGQDGGGSPRRRPASRSARG